MHGDDIINFKVYFVPGEHKHEVSAVELAVDKVSEAQISDRDEKAKKNNKKLYLLQLPHLICITQSSQM